MCKYWLKWLFNKQYFFKWNLGKAEEWGNAFPERSIKVADHLDQQKRWNACERKRSSCYGQLHYSQCSVLQNYLMWWLEGVLYKLYNEGVLYKLFDSITFDLTMSLSLSLSSVCLCLSVSLSRQLLWGIS